MQSILDEIRRATPATWGYWIGLILVLGVLIQCSLVLIGYMYRLFCQRRAAALARKELELNIRTAMARLRQAEQQQLTWNGYRKFKIAQKVKECSDVYSFLLLPHDRKAVPLFKPGQYLTFQLTIPGQPKPIVRCYSLSDSPHAEKSYRVTIKKAAPPVAGAPHGLASSYFCDSLKEGDIVDVKAPAGQFFLDLTRPQPLVLISAGVGITPMLSMLNAVIESGVEREVWFFFGSRNGRDHIQKDYLEKVAADHKYIRLHICYSAPCEQDIDGKDYHHKGRVTVELLKELLPSNNYHYFLCGPGPFMESITTGLREWGVPDSDVMFEAFGPATVKRTTPATTTMKNSPLLKVTFSRSRKVAEWNPAAGTLLDLADQQGVKLECGCRAGSCGSCVVAIKSGSVEYLDSHSAPPEEGSCLTCIARPRTDLVLEA
jgi:ferredoxin-NADP reductase